MSTIVPARGQSAKGPLESVSSLGRELPVSVSQDHSLLLKVRSRMAARTRSSIRIGIVGAGDNTRRRHIPGLRVIPGVELTGVVNRTTASTERVATEFGMRPFPDWKSLVADPSIDAIVIGTWPNLHSEVTCAALEAGKHVLCEARMARNVAEARLMQAASIAHPNCVAMLVPSPFCLLSDIEVPQLLDNRFIGDLRELVVLGADDQFHDYSRFFHWRQDADISGVNVLTLGILHETVLRWVPQPTRVFAQTQTFEPIRPNPSGPGNSQVTVPDSVQVLTQIPGGARGIYHFSGIDLHGPGKQIHLYGSSGTIKLIFGAEERILIGRVGDAELRELTIPPEKRKGWRVEAEFIGAIRGEEPVRRTDFAAGLQYMEFTEAVARSAASGLPVELPLA
jgi:predicted dehydrogenase